MKSVNTPALALLSMLVFVMGIALFFRGDLKDIKKLSGHTRATLQQMKQDCEKNLPRNKSCVIVVSAKITKEK